MLAIQSYDFSVRHIAGKLNVIADGLSRNPNAMCDATHEESDNSIVCLIMENIPITGDSLKEETIKDKELIDLKRAIDTNWHITDLSILKYKNWKDGLSVTSEGLITYYSRILIPFVLRKKILSEAHVGHIGVTKLKHLLRPICVWPGMSSDIDSFVRECGTCTRFSKINKIAPLESVANKIENTWEVIGIDFTGPSEKLNGNILLTIIDYASRLPFAIKVKSTDAANTIRSLSNIFSIFGLPKVIVSDNGPAFRSGVFADFLCKSNITHYFSSAYYPQGNGVVERLHGTLKQRLQKLLYEGRDFSESLQQVLFDMRSTAHSSTGRSPFFLMFGREMQGRWKWSTGHTTCPISDLQQRYDVHNQRHHAKLLQFTEGQRVVFCRGFGQPFEHHAVIVKSTGRGCWNVRTQSGRQQVVNQRFLRPYHSQDSSEAEWHWPDDVEDASPSLMSSASPVDSSTRNHRYNLRRNAVESSKYRV